MLCEGISCLDQRSSFTLSSTPSKILLFLHILISHISFTYINFHTIPVIHILFTTQLDYSQLFIYTYRFNTVLLSTSSYYALLFLHKAVVHKAFKKHPNSIQPINHISFSRNPISSHFFLHSSIERFFPTRLHCGSTTFGFKTSRLCACLCVHNRPV